LVRLVLGGADRGGSDVDAGGVEPGRRAHQHVVAGPAADIQHAAGDGVGSGEGEECRLRSRDVPSWLAGVDLLPVRLAAGERLERVMCSRFVVVGLVNG
jgi:hypothetical protein